MSQISFKHEVITPKLKMNQEMTHPIVSKISLETEKNIYNKSFAANPCDVTRVFKLYLTE